MRVKNVLRILMVYFVFFSILQTVADVLHWWHIRYPWWMLALAMPFALGIAGSAVKAWLNQPPWYCKSYDELRDWMDLAVSAAAIGGVVRIAEGGKTVFEFRSKRRVGRIGEDQA